MSRPGWLLVAVSAVVVAAIGFGLREAGSPVEARRERIDARRVDDLRMLANALQARRHAGAVPSESLYRDVAAGLPDHARDPATGRPYGFRVRPGGGFELGARFDLARPPADLDEYDRAWSHGPGEWWFGFTGRNAGGPAFGTAGDSADVPSAAGLR